MSADVHRDPFRIFLSGSTADFADVRGNFSESIGCPRLHFIHRDDFPPSATDTILKVAQLIAPCGILVHVVSREHGPFADDAAVAEYRAFLAREGGFLSRLPWLRDELRDYIDRTHTQWEIYIALHLGLRVLIFGDITHPGLPYLQRLFFERLADSRRCSGAFIAPISVKDQLGAILLGSVTDLLRAAQRHREAEPLLRRALAEEEARLGQDRALDAIRSRTIAQLLQSLGRLDEAERLMRRALLIDKVTLGPNDFTLASAMYDLACLLQQRSRPDEAVPLLRRSVQIFESHFGKDHPALAGQLRRLARLLQATRRHREAESLRRRATAIDEASFGWKYSDEAEGLCDTALLFLRVNRHREAESMIRRALAMSVAGLGVDHPKSQLCLRNLALILAAKRQLAAT